MSTIIKAHKIVVTFDTHHQFSMGFLLMADDRIPHAGRKRQKDEPMTIDLPGDYFVQHIVTHKNNSVTVTLVPEDPQSNADE